MLHAPPSIATQSSVVTCKGEDGRTSKKLSTCLLLVNQSFMRDYYKSVWLHKVEEAAWHLAALVPLLQSHSMAKQRAAVSGSKVMVTCGLPECGPMRVRRWTR